MMLPGLEICILRAHGLGHVIRYYMALIRYVSISFLVSVGEETRHPFIRMPALNSPSLARAYMYLTILFLVQCESVCNYGSPTRELLASHSFQHFIY